MKKVVYLGYYDSPENPRHCSPAASTMMRYVAGAMAESGYEVEIISPALTDEVLPELLEKENNFAVRYLPSYGVKNHFFHKVKNKIIRKQNLYNSLLNEMKTGAILVVYHSMAYIDVLKRIRKENEVKLILQVNEIYADVTQNKKERKKEMKWINSADAYIFSTEELSKQIMSTQKKYAVCLGTYCSEKKVERKEEEKMSKNVEVIYAGTFDPRKGGGIAIKAASYLPANYHMHICGFGNSQQIDEIKALISEINRTCACNVSYDGCLHGEEYLRKVQSCDIGLSTQEPGAAFNSTSFPSKILSYMSNGLSVVSIRLPVIESSPVGKYMFFYDNQSPEEVAKAIVRASDTSNCRDMQSVLDELNAGFCENIKEIFET